ncbi:SH3 domain-containing protein [Microbacterium sp. LjRoot45]|uniref:SH3 domain-containing protein n=1 Tax=Microbacterium sp. LjRoot45 TaxID=3342329 RepID=UPI003ECEE78A
MPPRRTSRSLVAIAAAAVFALTVGLVGVSPALSATAAPIEEPITPAVARIVTVDTTVRAEPSHSAAAVEMLAAGDEVSVSAQVPAWRKISVDGVEGWVPYSVTQVVPTEFEGGRGFPRELTADVTLRAQPGEKAVAVATVLKHSYVKAYATAGTWRKIETANGTGWVMSSKIIKPTYTSYAATKDLNVRASASGSTEIVLTLKKGQKVVVLGTRDGWSSVRAGSYGAAAATYSGWTTSKYLVPTNIRVTETALNLRTKAWTGSVVTVIPKGAKVTLTGSSVSNWSRSPKTWREVRYGSYRGWVAAAYLALPY